MKRMTLVKIKKNHPKAVVPKYQKVGDAGLDLVATRIVEESLYKITYGTGISMEIPHGYVGLVYPRSSVRNKDLILSNSVGVIDSGYRGEIMATFRKTLDNYEGNIYEVGDRICQIIIVPYPLIDFVEVDELSDSDRGDGGFGSTGK